MPSKNPSKKHLLLKNLLRTLLRSMLLHDPLGVHPKLRFNSGRFKRGGGNGKGGIRSWLPVHCLSALPDRQPYCHTNATSHSVFKHDQIAQERKSSLKIMLVGRDIPRTSRQISGRTSRAQKLSPHRSERRKIKFSARTSLTRRRGRP